MHFRDVKVILRNLVLINISNILNMCPAHVIYIEK
jgi:hypothetical protein